MPSRSWLMLRVTLSVALMVGFYLLALGIAGGLLWIAYADYAYFHRIDRFEFFCVAMAMAVLLSVVPRSDHFEPPGPKLDEEKEPRLFAFVREIAAATGQQMPSEIHVLDDVNAFVAQRGGTLGFGGRRVMGIGLPLLQAMPAREVKSVVAHEFGHFASSDVALAPWIYLTRSTIARTIATLEESFIGKPFKWYGLMFMRVTMSVSRRQEFVADQMSARIVGADVAAQALQRVSTMEPAYLAYRHHEVMPVLRAGFVPPISEGFQTFITTARYQELSVEATKAADADHAADSFDSHPPLRDRLAALRADAVAEPLPALEPASSLLNHPDVYVFELMKQSLNATTLGALTPVAWEHVGEKVYARQWRGFVLAHAQWLAPLTLETMPRGRDALLKFVKPMKVPGGFESDRRIGFATALLGAAVGTLLLDQQWRLAKRPGEDMVLLKDGRRFEPFVVVESFVIGGLDEQQWLARCRELGLSGSLLSEAAAVEAAPVLGAAASQTSNPDVPDAARRRRRSW